MCAFDKLSIGQEGYYYLGEEGFYVVLFMLFISESQIFYVEVM